MSAPLLRINNKQAGRKILMEITKHANGDKITLSFTGRLDTTTAPQAENTAMEAVSVSKDITFDFTNLEYLSSAGLRVILAVHKKMVAKGGTFTVSNVNEIIMKVFKITGFVGIINIK